MGVWRLKACNGWAHHTQTMCGARCVSFTNSVVENSDSIEPVVDDDICGIGYKYSHEGYWSSAHYLRRPYGKVLSAAGIDVRECAAKCNSISGCKAFSLWGGQDCWAYNELGSVKLDHHSKACVKK